jgi:hypothetical protein
MTRPTIRRAWVAARSLAAGVCSLLVASALVLIGTSLPAADAVSIEAAPAPNEHARLMFYRDADGHEQPVRSAADWQKRRSQILEGMGRAMGTPPDRAKLDIPAMEVKDEVKEPRFTRLTVKIAVDPRYSVPAYLYLPKGRPAGA